MLSGMCIAFMTSEALVDSMTVDVHQNYGSMRLVLASQRRSFLILDDNDKFDSVMLRLCFPHHPDGTPRPPIRVQTVFCLTIAMVNWGWTPEMRSTWF